MISIVFVHGLGGNRIDTWTSEPTKQVPLKTFWPKDLLPKQCPTARILSFGYDSHFVSFFRKQLAQEVTIDNYSTALCQHLASLRETTNTPADRPIIYVAHSLGGLVAANAVSRTQGANEAAKKLADNTVGMIFLGTPFAGSDKARWGGIGVGLANLLGLKTKDTDIEDLKEGSAKLTEINRNFKNLIKERDRNHELRKLEVVCYFEEHPTYVARKHLGSMVSIGKIVDKDSAGDIQADMLSIADNHSDMCKFGAEYLAGYQSVSGQLVQWIKALDRKIDKDGKNKVSLCPSRRILDNNELMR